MWIRGGRAVQLHVEKCWKSSIVTCAEVLGELYSYMWRSVGTAV